MENKVAPKERRDAEILFINYHTELSLASA